MCQATTATGAFDASLCPLLAGLEPEEQEQRMRDDPRIAGCIAALEAAASRDGAMGFIGDSEPCPGEVCPMHYRLAEGAVSQGMGLPPPQPVGEPEESQDKLLKAYAARVHKLASSPRPTGD